ncbi:family 20 glycosylhydrolase [Dyella tabacisoli]|uniref:beta-N-acetylhexosaminidase n=1 Tax=Dyella tabacisoli TaxID=2282381 RepID=A0A369UM47_9GAMM|nr:family 20 glycosylhydrolase [Dyella tabacisoli]RDD80778.1 beta-hexosaminidase [Dyella tabacisoli]
MSKLRLLLCLALCSVTAFAQAADTRVELIPMPAQLTRADGSFSVNEQTPIVVPPGDAAALHAANYLVGLAEHSRGLSLQVRESPATGAAITLQRDASINNREGYTLDVTPKGIRIAARDDAGLFYGAVTLWQLLTPNGRRGEVSVPSLHIRDEPRFSWRGMMLDSSRHMQSVEEIEGLLDQMAAHKLNSFHWHLTDDQGWRIEIKRYPELTKIGAWRDGLNEQSDQSPQRYGGFYTQDQIRHIVAYAAERQITVVPEIDLPGHAQAAVASYPELGVTGKRPPVSPDWGVNPYLYNVDDPTLRFVENVLDEVMDLFPSTYIHLGGDEAVKDQWQASSAIQAKMRALGVKDENALQSWFMGQLGTYLNQHGRRLLGWDEILEGGLPASATVMSWRGSKGAIDAARQGHDVVLSAAPDLYFDNVQSDRDDELSGRLPPISLAKVYGLEAVPKELNAAQAKHVLGLQANVWTEHLPTISHVQHALFPRLDAVAEAAWSPVAKRNWSNFLSRLPAQFVRYGQQNINVADSAFAPVFELDRNAALASGKARVTLTNQAKYGALHYTLDGSTPGLNSPLYSKPLDVTMPGVLKVATFAADGSALSASRQRALDTDSLLGRNSGELVNCPGSDFTLRLQPMPDATSQAPAYNVNIFDACRLYRQARLDGVASISVQAARLPRNYALAHEAKLVKSHPASTPHGELLVHQGNCDGPLLTTLPLPGDGSRDFTLEGPLLPRQGVHDLCLIFTAPTNGPLYAIDKVTLIPGQVAKAAKP